MLSRGTSFAGGFVRALAGCRSEVYLVKTRSEKMSCLADIWRYTRVSGQVIKLVLSSVDMTTR